MAADTQEREEEEGKWREGDEDNSGTTKAHR